jgi:hypothetical protein
MLVLQRYFIMQPAIAAAGATEILFAWLWQRDVRAVPPVSRPNASSSTAPAPGRGEAGT